MTEPSETDRPLSVSLSFAVGADGKIADARYFEDRAASETESKRLRALREEADARLVGSDILECCDTSLTAPGVPASRQPLRCVVSRAGRMDPSHRLFRTPGGPVHWLVTGPDDPPAEIEKVATLHRGTLAGFLGTLHRNLGVRRIHCEGGSELVRELFALDLVETLHLTWFAHTLTGGRDAPGLTGIPGEFLPTSRRFRLVEFEPRTESGECLLIYQRGVEEL